jgi:hypothetical protein
MSIDIKKNTTKMLGDINECFCLVEVTVMRVSKEQQSQNRLAIIKVASALCREQEYKALDIATLIRDAGFIYNSSNNPFDFCQIEDGVKGFSLEDYLEWIAAQVNGAHCSEATDQSFSEKISLYKVDSLSEGLQSASFKALANGEHEVGTESYSERIEMHLELLMRYLPSLEFLQGPECHKSSRHQALYILSKLVGSVILSSSVVKESQSLAEEILGLGAYVEDS